MKAVAVAIAGLCGALARYLIGGYLAQRWPATLPVATASLNVSGAFLLGLLSTSGGQQPSLHPTLRAALTIGFAGALTTFSIPALETWHLLQKGHAGLAMLYAAGSLFLAVLAAGVGATLGRLMS